MFVFITLRTWSDSYILYFVFIADATDDKRISDELQTVTVAAIADNTGYVLHPQSSLTLPKKTTVRYEQVTCLH